MKADSNRDKFERPDSAVSYDTQMRILNIVRNFLLVLILGYILLPLYWLTVSAFKPREHLFTTFKLVPEAFTLQHVNDLLFHTEFPRFIINSMIVTAGATVVTVCLALLGGYGLARTQFRGQRNLARVVLFTYMFPYILIGIPLYIIFFNAGLLNTYIALILAHTTIALPFCLWLMWQFFQTIPIDFEESAWVTGASRPRAFWDVVVPMSLPGIIAVAIFAFATSWSDFTLAVILMTESDMQTFPVGIQNFMQQDRFHWGMLTASGFFVMIPAFLLVFFLQRYMLVGFSIGE